MTYPEVSEITNPRCEWQPEQVSPTEPKLNRSALSAREVQQQRIAEWGRHAELVHELNLPGECAICSSRPIPTVCPKR